MTTSIEEEQAQIQAYLQKVQESEAAMNKNIEENLTINAKMMVEKHWKKVNKKKGKVKNLLISYVKNSFSNLIKFYTGLNSFQKTQVMKPGSYCFVMDPKLLKRRQYAKSKFELSANKDIFKKYSIDGTTAILSPCTGIIWLQHSMIFICVLCMYSFSPSFLPSFTFNYILHTRRWRNYQGRSYIKEEHNTSWSIQITS